MPETGPRYLISSEQIRVATVLGSAGMILTILLLFLMVTIRPQGDLRPVDGSAHQAARSEARAHLAGYELVGEDGARIDIAQAMALVVERGVGLDIAPLPPVSP